MHEWLIVWCIFPSTDMMVIILPSILKRDKLEKSRFDPVLCCLVGLVVTDGLSVPKTISHQLFVTNAIAGTSVVPHRHSRHSRTLGVEFQMRFAHPLWPLNKLLFCACEGTISMWLVTDEQHMKAFCKPKQTFPVPPAKTLFLGHTLGHPSLNARHSFHIS